MRSLLKTGAFISGSKGSGKTTLAMSLADSLMREGCILKVFDISGKWRIKSSIPNLYIPINSTLPNIPLYTSITFDLTLLTPRDMRNFITRVLRHDFERQVRSTERKWIVYVFEECQLLIPQGKLRSNVAQEVLRILTVGRNYNISYIAITQRPATVDTTVLELTDVQFFGKCTGQNDLKKLSNYVANVNKLKKLKVGEFILIEDGEEVTYKSELFEGKGYSTLFELKEPFVFPLEKILTYSFFLILFVLLLLAIGSFIVYR